MWRLVAAEVQQFDEMTANSVLHLFLFSVRGIVFKD